MSRIARILRRLDGRQPPTMLGGWQARRVSPFRTLIGTILSARARDEMTDVIAAKLFRRFPGPRSLASAPLREVERILRPIGFYRTKARYVTRTAARIVEQGGRVARTLEGLTAYPGVGRKVANCVLVYAFGQDAIPVDTHVHRLSNRLGWVRTRTPEETEARLVKLVPRALWPLVNEVFVAHGKRVCRPVGPLCGTCVIRTDCARRGVRGARGGA
jgi:endonuclease-3